MFSRTWVRLALSSAALVLITVGILALLLVDEFENREEDALRARLGDQARAVAYNATPLFGTDPLAITDTNQLAHEMAATFGTRVTLIRPDGLVVGDSEQDPALMENHATRPEVQQAIVNPGSLGSDSRLSATVHRNLLYVATAVTNPLNPAGVIGVARVAYPLTSVEEARNSLLRSLALTVLLVSVPAILLVVLLSRSIVGPISTLRDTARRLGRGDLSARSQMKAGGEIGDLGREFDTMAYRLEGTIATRTSERNQMAAVLSYMQDGVVITNSDGRIAVINKAAARLFGTTPEASEGHSIIEVSHNHNLHQALIATLASPTERHSLETDVGTSTISAVISAVPSPSGSNEGLIVLQDVTELRRLERVRRDFVANIGHELRTPLASIKLLVETLEATIHDDPELAQVFLDRIDVELDGLTQLVRELLELSRIESGQVQLHRKPIYIEELLERAAFRLRAQAERAGLTLTVQPNGNVPMADADPDRVEQVLVNLTHNATKFTPPGGHITLHAEPKDGSVLVSVSDTGMGIPPDDLPRIFERFYKVDKARTGTRERDREGGTGLGLAIAKHIVQAHGGQIWAESRMDEGTTFFFTLPQAATGK